MPDFSSIRNSLDDSKNFSDLTGSPYYNDAIYERFSDEEYKRRHSLLREYMKKQGYDCLIVCGGPNHWSTCYGVGWLTGHYTEWHSMAVYLVFPLNAEPTLIYSMGGTHIEAVRRYSFVKDVRHSKKGKFGEVIAQILKEIGLTQGRIGITECDSRFHEFMPVNHYLTLVKELPNVRFELIKGPFHELWCIKSQEELDAIERAAKICDAALQALIESAKPGVKEYELKATVAKTILERGANYNFIIIGSTPMSNPNLVFGNPYPSGRKIQEGDIIINEIAVEYKGFQAQIGSPVCVGKPLPSVIKFFNEIVLEGFNTIREQLKPGNTLEDVRRAAQFFRRKGYQSRPLVLHGLGVSSEGPEVNIDKVEAEEYEFVLKPNMTLMLEPNPITPDGRFGIFLGHPFVITKDGNRKLTDFPLELSIAH